MSDVGKSVGSTFWSLIPFGGGSTGSGAPYVGDIQPTVAKAAAEAPRTRSTPAGPEPAQAVPYSTKPGAAEQDAKPTARGSDSRRSDAAPAKGLHGTQFAEATPKPTAEDKANALDQSRRHFQDDGRFPNLSGVPARPTDLPSSAEIAARLKSMQDERGQALARSVTPPGEAPDAVPEVTNTGADRPSGRINLPGQPDAVAIEPSREPASPATAIPAPRPDGSPRAQAPTATLIV
ncbi:hypothetical protein [Roseiterribacter gracilis]